VGFKAQWLIEEINILFGSMCRGCSAMSSLPIYFLTHRSVGSKYLPFGVGNCMIKDGVQDVLYHLNWFSLWVWFGCSVPEFCPKSTHPTPAVYHFFMPVPCTSRHRSSDSLPMRLSATVSKSRDFIPLITRQGGLTSTGFDRFCRFCGVLKTLK